MVEISREDDRPVVAILGASPKPERFANKAQRMLTEYGYPVAPITPKGGPILGEKTYRTLAEYPQDVDTVTLYVGPQRLAPLVDDIVEKRPRRVIFNPGTEDDAIRRRLEGAGIETLEDCTLVMLMAGRF